MACSSAVAVTGGCASRPAPIFSASAVASATLGESGAGLGSPRPQILSLEVVLFKGGRSGPGDTFDETRGHVVAALIRKAVLAAELRQESFEVWGDGSATQDFVYVKDVAE